MLGTFCFLLFFVLLSIGPVGISLSEIFKLFTNQSELSATSSMIFWDYRLPKVIVAILGGAALAVSGLLMQTFFQNPLAGPYVLGVQSGAALGVACWTLLLTPISHLLSPSLQSFGVTFASILGSSFTLSVLLLVSFRMPNKLIILIFGLLFAQVSGGIINICISLSNAQALKSFMLWSLGSFQQVAGNDLIIFSAVIMLGIFATVMIAKPLNLLLLGDEYAKTLGLKSKKTNYSIIFLVSILSGTVTAFCGPIGFLGIITPHVARKFLRTNNHYILIPAVALLGAMVAMTAEVFAGLNSAIAIPLNAILGLMGVPFIMVFLWRGRQNEVVF